MMAVFDCRDGLAVLAPTAMPAAPLSLVVDAAGAVLEWPLLAPSNQLCQVTVLDVADASWLWLLVGEQAQISIITAMDVGTSAEIDLDISEHMLAGLRRIGYGHWLRRWWPNSLRLGIPELDAVLLDAELAVLAADYEQVLTPGTLDADPVQLLAEHTEADLMCLAQSDIDGHRRIGQQALALAHQAGLLLKSGRNQRRPDYALAASGPKLAGTRAILSGVSTVCWQAVPPGIFDAAEKNLSWSLEANPAVTLQVSTALVPGADPSGIGFDVVVAGQRAASGVLDADGRALVPLELTAEQAWQLTPDSVTVTVGADIDEPATVRDAVREFATARLGSCQEADSFLAERDAAASDF